MPQDRSHEVRILLTNGSTASFTLHELRRFLSSSNVLVLIVGAVILLAMSNPSLFSSLPVYSSRAFYWSISIGLYVAVLPLWVGTLWGIWSRITTASLPLFLGSAPLVVALSALAEQLPDLLGEWTPPRGQQLQPVDYLRNSVIAHVIESIALIWLLPLYRASKAKSGATGSSDRGARFVVLNGRSIPVERIRSVTSAEHYLILDMDHGKTEIRARMKDFLGQLGEDSGIQIHRSVWLAASEAVALEGGIVQTRSGVTFPVSRGRAQAVRDWFRKHGKAH